MAKFKIGDRVRAMKDGLSHNSHIKKGMAGDVIDIRIGDVCVEFDDSIYGHSNPLGESGKPNHCWWVSNEEVTLITENKIVITTDGKETLARLYENDKVVKSAVAKCSPEDTFDFNTGAKIAFDRLMEQTEEKPDEKYRVVNRLAKEGDYIRLKTPLRRPHYSFSKPGDIMRVAKEIGGCCYVRDCDHPRPTIHGVKLWLYLPDDYEVIEPIETPEEKPKYYNGKVVCVKKEMLSVYTVGKVYEFINGKVKIDNGITMPIGDGITTLDEWNKDPDLHCEFIPFVE